MIFFLIMKKKWLPLKNIPILRPEYKNHALFMTRISKIPCPIYDQNGWKTIPFGAVHTYIAHTRKSPPPGGIIPQHSQWVLLNSLLLRHNKGKLNVYMKRKLVINIESCNFTSCLVLQQSERHYWTLEINNYNSIPSITHFNWHNIQTNCLSIARSENSSVSWAYQVGDFLFSYHLVEINCN